MQLLPQLFFEWKKAVSTHRRHFVVKKGGQNYFREVFTPKWFSGR